MTPKQLLKLAKVRGWVLHRNGSKHMVFRHPSGQQITIPYRPRPFVANNIAKQLNKAA
tara:strand:- start:504 stop:677 length:174 start_codon:yes stop_codon:yes gene_type:complete